MNENLKKLIAIQELDATILARRRLSDEIPKRVEETSVLLDGAKKKKEEFDRRVEAIDRRRRDHERELAEHEDRIRKIEARASSLRTNDEYQAHLKEVEKAKELTGRIEEKILLAMEDRDRLEPERETVDRDMAEATARWAEAKKILEQEGKKLEVEIQAHREKRAVLAANIPEDLYANYMECMRQNAGRAVVPAVSEICQGCHLNMPPQHFNNLKRNEEVLHCPACGRIIYFQEEG